MNNISNLEEIIRAVPTGYSEVKYKNKKYSLNKTEFNNGKSIKVYAEELGGNDFISFNYYKTDKDNLLKPCEMPEEKVLEFLNEMKIL